MKRNILLNILKEWGLSFQKITHKEVTSRPNDYREILVLDKQWVLRINSVNAMSEERLSELNRLIERYHSIGVYAPAFIKNIKGNYLVSYEDKVFYVSEYADYALASDLRLNPESLFHQKMKHLGILANRYTNYDLMKARSMWSILDLAPLDIDIDEKQENCNTLIALLKELSEPEMAKRIEGFNQANREAIQMVFDDLPRCVYQGDLNDSNILIKDGQFFGLIDFNMAGTEVNINCFLSETAYMLEDEDFLQLNASEILSKILQQQDAALHIILENYALNEIEKRVFENYRNIILISQYPYVCMYSFYLKSKIKSKVLELFDLILKRKES